MILWMLDARKTLDSGFLWWTCGFKSHTTSDCSILSSSLLARVWSIEPVTLLILSLLFQLELQYHMEERLAAAWALVSLFKKGAVCTSRSILDRGMPPKTVLAP